MPDALKKLRYVRTSRLLLFAMIGLAAAMYACYPGGATNVSDYDLVITAFDETFDFDAAQTFSMPDSVVSLDPTETIPQTTQNLILQTITDNLTAYGWTEIPNPTPTNQPDVVVLVGSTTQDWGAWVSYPWYGYWGWWPGWSYYPPGYGAGWGWYYPYPPSGSYYEYSVGSLLIDMAKSIPDTPADSLMEGVWGAGLNGVLSGSQATDQQRLVDGIDAAFTQSPYLDTN